MMVAVDFNPRFAALLSIRRIATVECPDRTAASLRDAGPLIDHSEEPGNAFEYPLSAMGSQGENGQFRTPRHIIDLIVDVVDPQKEDTILDPRAAPAAS